MYQIKGSIMCDLYVFIWIGLGNAHAYSGATQDLEVRGRMLISDFRGTCEIRMSIADGCSKDIFPDWYMEWRVSASSLSP